MNKTLAIALATAALASVATTAFAQETKPLGLSLRAGIFWPTDSAAKNSGNTWFIGGAEYKVGDLHFGASQPGYQSSWSVSVDWYQKNDYRNLPVLLNYVGRKDQFFYSAGAGVGFTRRPVTGGTKSQTELAYQVGVGYDFMKGQTPLFVEVKWHGSGESKLNGFAAYIGVRF